MLANLQRKPSFPKCYRSKLNEYERFISVAWTLKSDETFLGSFPNSVSNAEQPTFPRNKLHPPLFATLERLMSCKTAYEIQRSGPTAYATGTSFLRNSRIIIPMGNSLSYHNVHVLFQKKKYCSQIGQRSSRLWRRRSTWLKPQCKYCHHKLPAVLKLTLA